MLRNNVMLAVTQLLQQADKHLVLTALKFLRQCVGVQEVFYNRYSCAVCVRLCHVLWAVWWHAVGESNAGEHALVFCLLPCALNPGSRPLDMTLWAADILSRKTCSRE